MGRKKFEGSDWERFLQYIESFKGAEGICPITIRNDLGFDKVKSKIYLHRAFKQGILIKRRDKRRRIVRGIYDKVVSLPPQPTSIVEEKETTDQAKPSERGSPPMALQQRQAMHQPQLSRKDIRFHAYTFVLKRTYFKDSELSGYYLKHSLVDSSSNNFIEERLPALQLFEPMVNGQFSDKTISRLWNTKGYLYNEYFKSYTGSVEYDQKRTIRFEVFSNNTVNIYVECSENPLNAVEVLAMYDVLKALIKLLTGLDGRHLSDLLIVKRVETNIDREIGAEKIDSIPFQKLTLTNYLGDHIQLYLKEIDEEMLMRTEIVREPNQKLSEFMSELDALTFGGLPGQFVWSELHMLQREIRDLKDSIKSGFDRFFNAQTISPLAMGRLINTADRIDAKLPSGEPAHTAKHSRRKRPQEGDAEGRGALEGFGQRACKRK